ncbi:hypothetical protein Ae201684P_003947 [Aphanomyces euteiches]|nr:hypothetical protein Ae201684P_003947 [Aphanomyces euteiches]
MSKLNAMSNKFLPPTWVLVLPIALIIIACFHGRIALFLAIGALSLKPKAILIGLATFAFGLYLTKTVVTKMRKKNKPGFSSASSAQSLY